MLDAIDERTLLVPISHVLYKSAWLQDAKAIVEKAHAVGARVILDCYQSAGTVPFSLTELERRLRVRRLASSGSAAGRAPAGSTSGPICASSCRPKRDRLDGARGALRLRAGRDRIREGLYRFLHGSPAIPALFAALPGYRTIRDVGVAKIRRKSLRQTELLRAAALERGLRVTSPVDPNSPRRDDHHRPDAAARRREATAALDDRLGAAVVKSLATREILVDFRPGAGVRVSPHFYTTDDELLGCLDAMVEIVKNESSRGATREAPLTDSFVDAGTIRRRRAYSRARRPMREGELLAPASVRWSVPAPRGDCASGSDD